MAVLLSVRCASGSPKPIILTHQGSAGLQEQYPKRDWPVHDRNRTTTRGVHGEHLEERARCSALPAPFTIGAWGNWSPSHIDGGHETPVRQAETQTHRSNP